MDLHDIFEPVAGELVRVESELARQIDRIVRDPIVQTFPGGEGAGIVRHVFSATGKRLRPGLLLLSARAVGPVPAGRAPMLAQMAAAAELIHTASLVHDDVIDRAAARREQVSLNGRYGDKIAVLVGDLLYTQFFRMAAGLGGVSADRRLRILERFCDVTRSMCLAEICEEQARARGKEEPLERYLAIIEGKTATLMSACCATGALLNGAADREADALSAYGRWLGLSYQLVDDLLDGDAVFTRREGLREQLLACTGRAREEARRLPRGEASGRLVRFADALWEMGKEDARDAVRS